MDLLCLLLVVSIVLESFPISSSGHLVLLEKFMLHASDGTYASLINHLANISPAIIIPIFFYDQFRIFFRLLYKKNIRLLAAIVCCGAIAEIITVAFYLFWEFVKPTFFPLSIGFLVTACLLLSLYWCRSAKASICFSWQHFVVLGMVQGCALLPGISRFASTFVAGRWLGFSAYRAFFISFLMQWPIAIAGFFKGISMIPALEQQQLLNMFCLFIMLVAMVFAFGGLMLMRRIINAGRISLFAWYMLLMACIAFVMHV